MKIFLLFFLILPTFAQSECGNIKYKYKVKGKDTYFTKKLCKKKKGKFTLIYSKNCEKNNCDLLKKLKEKNPEKKLLGAGSFGSPQFLKCRSLDGSPQYVEFDPKFYTKKTMLCFSKVDDSILNTDSLYRWHDKKIKAKIKTKKTFKSVVK